MHLDQVATNLQQKAPQALLVVGTSPPDKNGHIKLHQFGLELLQSCHNALESGCNVCEVGNSTSDDQNLVLIFCIY